MICAVTLWVLSQVFCFRLEIFLTVFFGSSGWACFFFLKPIRYFNGCMTSRLISISRLQLFQHWIRPRGPGLTIWLILIHHRISNRNWVMFFYTDDHAIQLSLPSPSETEKRRLLCQVCQKLMNKELKWLELELLWSKPWSPTSHHYKPLYLSDNHGVSFFGGDFEDVLLYRPS